MQTRRRVGGGLLSVKLVFLLQWVIQAGRSDALTFIPESSPFTPFTFYPPEDTIEISSSQLLENNVDNPIVISSIPVTFVGSIEEETQSSGLRFKVFFSFTPTENFSALVDTCGTTEDFDTVLSIYVGNILMAENDDAQFICSLGKALQSGITNFHFLQGYTYTIVLGENSSDNHGQYMFNIRDVEYLPNGKEFVYLPLNKGQGNSMDDPLEISTAPFTVFGTTATSFTNTHQLGDGPDVFFRYRPEETVIANISTCGSKFDTEIGLFVDGNLIAFNDDDMTMVGDTAVFFCDQSDGTTQSALQNIVLSKEQTYIIAVDGFDGESYGQFDLVVEVMQAPTSTDGSSVVKSDPHLRGFRGQEFEFVGQPNAIYNFLTMGDVVVNALLGAAYTTGLQFEAGLDGLPMRQQGTWVQALGLRIHDQRLVISSTDEATLELEAALLWAPECTTPAASGSLDLGLVFVDFIQYCKIGTYQLDHQIHIELRNSKSFSRVRLTSPLIEMKVDIVPPPAGWGLDASTLVDDLFHINFAIDKLVISEDDNPSGVLGKTASDWTPTESADKVEEEENYVVSQLIS